MSIKKLTLIALAIIPIYSFAGYTAKIPLEVLQGGSLPTGSIVIGDGSSTPTNPETPVGNCAYDRYNGTSVVRFTLSDPFIPFAPGDTIYLYNGQFIGYNIAGYPAYVPAGVSSGKVMFTDVETGANYSEICANDLSSFETVTPPNLGEPEPEPEDPRITACYDKEPQVRSIIESYGSTLRNLSAYLDTDSDVVYCTADYNLPSGQARDDVINELNAIGVGTPM
jgi:hypothetical protein